MNENKVTLGKIKDFYRLLDKLERNLGGKCSLRDDNDSGLPETGVPGVYFIFEEGQKRPGSDDLRVVYVGTSTTLGQRLKFHFDGNRTNSSFRNIVGNALEGKDRKAKGYCLRAGCLEKEIKKHIKTTQFLWVIVDEDRDRKSIEKNAIGLLSTPSCTAEDPASQSWLGGYSDPKRRGIEYGLWNSDHVGKGFDSDFLNTLDCYIEKHINDRP